MPQLDKFTFSTQVVWLVLIFFFLYFILVQIGLPRLYRILYFRKKKLLSLNQGSVNFVSELFFFSNNLNSFLSGYVQRVKNFSEIFYRLPQQELDVPIHYNDNLNQSITKCYSLSSDMESIKNSLDAPYLIRREFGSIKKI